MRRVGMFLIAAMMAAGVLFCDVPVAQAAWSGGVEISDWYGDGSAVSFVIDTEDELAGFAVVVNGTDTPVDGFTGQDSFVGKTITLGADIDLTGHDWTPIGNQTHPFGGTFNGNEHSISGLSIGSADVPDAALKQLGLFGYANESSVISHLILDNTLIFSSLGSDDNFAFIGALAGISTGSIESCQSSGVLRGGYKSTVGGLVGEMGNFDGIGSIEDCQSSSMVTSGDGPSDAGGLIGRAERIPISNSSASGLVTCGSSIGATGAPFSGGFIGAASSTTISGCQAGGQVRGGDGSLAGGFCGYNDGSISDSDSLNTGGVMGGVNAMVGGFIGINLTTDDDVTNCHAYCTAEVGNAVSGDSYVGGFVGKNAGGEMVGCSASGNIGGGEARVDVGSEVTSALYAGGFAGFIEGDFYASNAVKNCTSSGSMIVDGALFGDCSDSSAYLYAGAFAGYIDCARVEGCGALGEETNADSFVLSGSGNTGGVYVGGFAGMAFGSQRAGGYVRQGMIINCYTRSWASARENANLGGFAGGCIVQDDEYGVEYTSFPLIYNSYTTGRALFYNSANVGGFVGYLQNANIVNSYAACDHVSESTIPPNEGGFAGYISTYGTDDLLINTYYDSGTVDSALESDAVGLNTSGQSVHSQGLRGALMRGETTGSVAYHNGDHMNEASTFLEALNGGIGLVNNLFESSYPDKLTWIADNSSVNRDYPVFGDKWEAPTPAFSDADNNTVSVNPASVASGSLTTITAVGDRQNEDGVMTGDMRYIPVSWSSNENGTSKGAFTFKTGSYTSSYTPSAAGTYTVTASFRLQGWDGESWVDAPDGYPGATDTKTAVLSVSAGLSSTPVISGLPDSKTIYTGARFTLTPSPAGGVWQWDSAYVTLSDNGGTVEIKGIKKGATIVSYSVGGVSKSITVIILASELPQTGQNFMWAWMLGGASVAAAGTALLIRRRNAIRQ